MTTFSPTNEQQIALAAAEAGEMLKIKAYAGAGKTSTLELIAGRFAHRRGSYRAGEFGSGAARRGHTAERCAG
ncbi:hypothetical protein [Paraburkholderia kururiensis]|uniref:hypothetical protein n=1 Tax=Paraburkholderia kururiensis TaxID=984307 RepID=UPI000F87E3C2|nr:hypothetical protein [Paraburkholderia kururiensis]